MLTRAAWMLLAFFVVCAPPAQAQDAQRDATREQVRATLNAYGPQLGMTFHQSEKSPYNFGGSLSTGLKYSDSLEIVVVVGAKRTIGVSIYPHYKGGYVNLDKARDSNGLARRLLRLDDTGFFYWAADDTLDLYAGFTFTLESGYPDAAMRIVLESIPNIDGVVGELRPLIDGS